MKKKCDPSLGVLIALLLMLGSTPLVASEFTMACKNANGLEGKAERLICKIKTDGKNSEAPKESVEINWIYLDFQGVGNLTPQAKDRAGPGRDGTRPMGGDCPTWIFRNGQWIKIC